MRVEQFELIREIGRGGMGQVFLARDTRLGRRVALKFLTLRSKGLLERFLLEARTTAQCHHENIVVIHQVGDTGGLAYLALEYLDGEPLSTWLHNRTVSAPRAIELMLPVARALVCAHATGIVHRDLKPANIFLTKTGLIKVLDFGIAKLVGTPEEVPTSQDDSPTEQTHPESILGTRPYMAPEQWRREAVDHRADLWSFGIILWRMLAGRHPLHPLTPVGLRKAALQLEVPMPKLLSAVRTVPPDLAEIVDTCLIKPVEDRIGSAEELVHRLELASPARRRQRKNDESSPYPGMTAFQEADADRFFGRGQDVERVVRRLEASPMLAVVGLSGAGKSSFVRAGIGPALRSQQYPWEVVVTRPGRAPLASLAALIRWAVNDRPSGRALLPGRGSNAVLTERLRSEPGYLGRVLRTRAFGSSAGRGHRILLFVDQFEELYTLTDDDGEQQAVTRCLMALADDVTSPLRLIIAVRADHLGRITLDREFAERVSSGLVFLAPLDRNGMWEALTAPLEDINYRFESDGVPERILDALDTHPGALPLLQFTAAALWARRDVVKRVLTDSSYAELGGVEGTLAAHADAMLASLAPSARDLARRLFRRLVTAERTRVLVDVHDLEGLSDEPGRVARVIETFVAGRLLIMHPGSDQSPMVELVHEALITGWPTLRRWTEENAEDTAFLDQLRSASKQWFAKGRSEGLLWTGEAAEEAKAFHRRNAHDLAATERAYLDAVEALRVRGTRSRRRGVVAAFIVMAAIIVAALASVAWIRSAERIAQAERRRAEDEATRAVAAERRVRAQLETIQIQRKTIRVREQESAQANRTAAAAEAKRRLTYDQLETALRRVQKLAKSEKSARQRAEALNRERQARIKKLERELRSLATELD